MNKLIRRVLTVGLTLMMGVGLLSMQACSGNATGNQGTPTPVPETSTPTPDPVATPTPADETVSLAPIPSPLPAQLTRADGQKNPQVTIELETGGKIVLVLYPEKAPNTVNNFLSLAQSGYYDGLIFHRVIPDFMIQGGDPDGTGTGGPGYGIKGEFTQNGFKGNDISHTPGVISMARAQSPDSAGSQFFICCGDANFLDGQYAAFGIVLSGLEEVYAVAAVQRDAQDKPNTDQKIKKITVDTFGAEYPKPETIKE